MAARQLTWRRRLHNGVGGSDDDNNAESITTQKQQQCGDDDGHNNGGSKHWEKHGNGRDGDGGGDVVVPSGATIAGCGRRD